MKKRGICIACSKPLGKYKITFCSDKCSIKHLHITYYKGRIIHTWKKKSNAAGVAKKQTQATYSVHKSAGIKPTTPTGGKGR